MLLRYLSFWKRLLLVSASLVLATACSSEPNLASTQVKSERSDGGEARLIGRFAGSEGSVDSERTQSIAVSDYDDALKAQELLPSNETNLSQIEPDPVYDPTAPQESVNASGSDKMNNGSEIIDLSELDKPVTSGSEIQSSITSTDATTGGSGQDALILQSTETSTPNPDQIVGVSGVVLGENSIQDVSEDLAVPPGAITGSNGADSITATGGNDVASSSCLEGYVPVPRNAKHGSSPFCVMKYEAQKPSDQAMLPVAVKGGLPWVNVGVKEAKYACLAAGAHLMTFGEWQAILAAMEQVSANNLGGSVGTQLPTGHSDSQPEFALAPGSDDNPYYQTGDNLDQKYQPGAPGKAQKRAFTLTNGEVIWDIAGNVSEWLDGGCDRQTWPVFSVSALDWSSKDIPNSLRSTVGLSPSSNATAGLGAYIGCVANGNALHVGGSYLAGTASGIYTIVMNATQSYTSSDVGFRCVQN